MWVVNQFRSNFEFSHVDSCVQCTVRSGKSLDLRDDYPVSILLTAWSQMSLWTLLGLSSEWDVMPDRSWKPSLLLFAGSFYKILEVACFCICLLESSHFVLSTVRKIAWGLQNSLSSFLRLWQAKFVQLILTAYGFCFYKKSDGLLLRSVKCTKMQWGWG